MLRTAARMIKRKGSMEGYMHGSSTYIHMNGTGYDRTGKANKAARLNNRLSAPSVSSYTHAPIKNSFNSVDKRLTR